MKTTTCFAIALGLLAFALSGRSAQKKEMPAAVAQVAATAPIFQSYADLKWDKMLPALGADSPEISTLRVDPVTHATQLMVHTPTAIHIPKHWHSANETHTIIVGNVSFACDGKRVEFGPGSFNFMPAKMVHEAWLPAGSITFITVDGAWDVNWVDGPPTAADLTK